jgi:hypothetical protein
MIVNFRRCAIVSLVASVTGPAVGSVTVTWNYQNWQGQAGNVTALDFNLGSAQILSNQYESLGVTFPDGDDYVAYFEQASGSSDKWFLRDRWGDLQTTFLFSQPQTAVGFKFGQGHFFKLYSGATMLYSSPEFGTTQFVGAISTIRFDRMVVSRSGGGPIVDTVWFGGTVPGPGGLAALGGAALLGRRRRRCGETQR